MATPSRLLVADDDVAVRRLLTVVLHREGYVVDGARDGAEAIAMLSEDRYDAVLLDLMMPNASGADVLLHMERALPTVAPRRVILVTAASSKHVQEIDPGRVRLVIRKPFDIAVLVEAVREICVG